MGDNIYLGDRNGVRTPMQWSADRNAGFSRANPQRLYLPPIIDPDFYYETVNVETQLNNPHSLLWWTRRLVALRKRVRAFGRGSIEFLHPSNGKVLAFVRRHEGRDDPGGRQPVPPRPARGAGPAGVPGARPGRAVRRDRVSPGSGRAPTSSPSAPHGFYWFSLEARSAAAFEVGKDSAAGLPTISVQSSWESFFRGRGKTAVEEILPAFLKGRRWFGGKARRMRGVEIAEAVPVPVGRQTAFLVLARVDYTEGDPDTYALTLAFATGAEATRILEHEAHRVLARMRVKGVEGALHGAVRGPGVRPGAAGGGRAAAACFDGLHGDIVGVPGRAFRRLRGAGPLEPVPARGRAEQHLAPLRGPADPEALPAGGGGTEPGRRDRPLPHREGGLPALAGGGGIARVPPAEG